MLATPVVSGHCVLLNIGIYPVVSAIRIVGDNGFVLATPDSRTRGVHVVCFTARQEQ